MAYADVNGTRLYYEIRGIGRPIMYIHGGLGLDHNFYSQVFEPLEANFQVIYIDLREHGKSKRTPKPNFTYEQLADDVDGLREHLGYNRVTLLGYSAGSWVAQFFALRHSDHLENLILYKASYENPSNLQEEVQPMIAAQDKRYPQYAERYKKFNEANKANPNYQFTNEQFAKTFHMHSYHYFHNFDEKMDESVKTYMNELLENNGFNTLAYLRDLNLRPNLNTHDELVKISQPTLIISGKYDLFHPTTQGEEMAKQIPNSRFVVLESGHVELEEPDLSQIITDFMQENSH